MGDLPVAHGEHNDVGKRELAGGCAGPEGFLLDDDRVWIVGVVDGKGARSYLNLLVFHTAAVQLTISSRPSSRDGTPGRVNGHSWTAPPHTGTEGPRPLSSRRHGPARRVRATVGMGRVGAVSARRFDRVDARGAVGRGASAHALPGGFGEGDDPLLAARVGAAGVLRRDPVDDLPGGVALDPLDDPAADDDRMEWVVGCRTGGGAHRR